LKIGYLCYNLHGFGPAVRARNLIGRISEKNGIDTVLITSQEEDYDDGTTEVHRILTKTGNPIKLARIIPEISAILEDVDVVHVPINIKQVLLTRLAYSGPVVIGAGDHL